jgi:hypothetical protein
MNWLAILCAGAAYWILGWLWYTQLFSKIWGAGLERYGVKLRPPTKAEHAAKMIGSFVANVIAAAVLAILVRRIGITDLVRGVKLGAAVGLGFSLTSLTIVYIWESKPTRLWLIDAGYHLLGCIIAAVILAVWH